MHYSFINCYVFISSGKIRVDDKDSVRELATLSTLSNEDPDYDDNGDYLTKIQKSSLVSFFN